MKDHFFHIKIIYLSVFSVFAQLEKREYLGAFSCFPFLPYIHYLWMNEFTADYNFLYIFREFFYRDNIFFFFNLFCIIYVLYTCANDSNYWVSLENTFQNVSAFLNYSK